MVQKLFESMYAEELVTAIDNAQWLSGVDVMTEAITSIDGMTSNLKLQEKDLDYKNLSASDYYTNGKIYSYDFLATQKDMVKVKLPDTGFLADKKGKIDDEKVLAEGIKNAHSEGTEMGGKVYVKNAYTGRELRIDNSTIKHGLDGTYNRHLTNARIGSVIGSVVKNAIPINGLKNKSKKAVGTYAMVSYCYDSQNRQFIAVVTVEQHTGNVDSFELYDVAHAVSGRQKKGSQVDTKSQGVYPIKATTISIADLLQIVNSTHKGILSEDVLAHFGETEKLKGGYADKVLFQERNLAPTFYSQIGKVVEGVKQEKLAANSVVNMLRGKGVKAEEIRWSGIVPFLEGKKSVTKQELLDFINGSMLQIGEQMSSNDIDLRYDSSNHAYIHYDAKGNVVDTYTYSEFLDGYVSEASEEIYSNPYELEDALREEYGEMASPRWAEYKLNGGENYREIVFTLPNSSYSNQMMRTHWGDDAEGVLAHARIQDFDVNGKKMLFIEEIQSDWHNEGHKEGYEGNPKNNERFEARKRYDELRKEKENLWQQLSLPSNLSLSAEEKQSLLNDVLDKDKLIEDEQDSISKKFGKNIAFGKEEVPDAPFKDNYHEYVMKRLLRMAAESGYDNIGWTPADIQSKRWSEDYAEGYRIEYDQDIPKFLKKYGRQWGAKVGSTVLNNGTEIWSMDITDSMKNSVLYEGQAMYQEKVTDKETLDFFEIVDKQMKNYDEYSQMVESKMPSVMKKITSIDGITSNLKLQAKEWSSDIQDDVLYPTDARERSAFNRSMANKTYNLKNKEKVNIMVYTADNAYFISANGYMSGKILFKETIDGNEDLINTLRKEFENETLTTSEGLDLLVQGIRNDRRRGYRSHASLKDGLAAEGYEGLDTESHIGNGRRSDSRSNKTSKGKVKYQERDSKGNQLSESFTDNLFKSFGIEKRKLGDYVHVQKHVFDTLMKEGFFTDKILRNRTDVNKESGMVVEINKSSIDETFSFNNFVRLGKFKKIAKLVTIRELPNVIKHGHMVADDVANKYANSENKKFAYIEYATEVDGKKIMVRIAIKKSPQKNKFWVHSVYNIENVSDSPASTNHGTEAGHITADTGRIVTQESSCVKTNQKISMASEDDVKAQYAEEKMPSVMKKITSIDGITSNLKLQAKSTTSYDFTKPFEQQVDDYKNGSFPTNDTLLVSGTPKVWQSIGFNALPVTINQTHVDYALNGTKDVDHHIGETLLKNLPNAIQNPLAIIQSQSKGHEDRVVVILEMDHNGKKVISAIEVDGQGTTNSINIDSNAMTTLFAKGNGPTQLKNAINNTVNGSVELFYWNKKEAVSLLQKAGVQFSSPLPQDGLVYSIADKGSKVKSENTKSVTPKATP